MQGIAHYTLQGKVWALRGSSVLPSLLGELLFFHAYYPARKTSGGLLHSKLAS